jgi:hypothetical protein
MLTNERMKVVDCYIHTGTISLYCTLRVNGVKGSATSDYLGMKFLRMVKNCHIPDGVPNSSCSMLPSYEGEFSTLAGGLQESASQISQYVPR